MRNRFAGKLTGMMMGTLKDGFGIAVTPPSDYGAGQRLGLTINLQDRNNTGHAALLAKRNELIQKMRASGLFDRGTVRASGLEDAPQLKIDINRAAAAVGYFVLRHPDCVGDFAGFFLCQRLPEPRPSATRNGSG